MMMMPSNNNNNFNTMTANGGKKSGWKVLLVSMMMVMTVVNHGGLVSAAASDSSSTGVKGVKSGTKGVANFLLDRLEGEAAKKTLWFYRYFGANLNRNKIDNLSQSVDTSCDYDDPTKIKYCPPVPGTPLHKAGGFAGIGAKAKQAVGGGDNGKPAESNPNVPNDDNKDKISPQDLIKCLDDPEHPDCVRLLQDTSASGRGEVAPRPTDSAGRGEVANRQSTNYVTQMPTGTSEGLATQEPTRDDCYGNMLDGRFCTSEMPSVSDSPTNVPTTTEEIPPGETAFLDKNKTELEFVNGATMGVCMIDVHNVDDSPKAEFGFPIELVSATESTVTFSLAQTWKRTPVDFMYTTYIAPPDGENRLCVRSESVHFGPSNQEFTALCDMETKVAYVLLIVHDASFGESSSVPLPTECDQYGDIDTEFKYGYSFQLPCDCDEGDVVLENWNGVAALNDTNTMTVFDGGAFYQQAPA